MTKNDKYIVKIPYPQICKDYGFFYAWDDRRGSISVIRCFFCLGNSKGVGINLLESRKATEVATWSEYWKSDQDIYKLLLT